jgi:hypothetical protein
LFVDDEALSLALIAACCSSNLRCFVESILSSTI